MKAVALDHHLVTLTEFLPVRAALRADGKKLVWTNGCFDLLHAGHVAYLTNAKELGDVLLVGLNSAVSFSQWKKRPGPINSDQHRAAVLLVLQAVDYVILFDEPSPVALLRTLQPDVYVKGDDYTRATIDPEERRAIESYGGQIAFCAGVPGVSTSGLIERILQLYSHRRRS